MESIKLFEINAVPYGSTGKIAVGISQTAKAYGCETLTYFGWTKHRRKSDQNVVIGSFFSKALNMIFGKLFGCGDIFSSFETRRVIKLINKFNPKIVHLHIMHSWYLNLSLLFDFLKKHNIKVIWTLHDCWAFTGHCPHFTMEKCDKWQTGCFKCPRYRDYPQSFFDNSKKMWKLKKKWFTGVKNLTIVTPSEWLAGLVKQSFLKDYPVKVIHNGIDLNIFKPTASNFREKYNIGDKFIVLGVAFGWGIRKGLDVFIELSKRLDNEKYQIVLVGTDGTVDKQLPKNIISIHRTQNQTELAEIYTAADVFVNPTREEVLGLVNIEANACGTPVVVFDTGGAPECIDNKSGVVVNYNDVEGVIREVDRIRESIPFSKNDCINRAKQFDMNAKYKEYVDLYNELCKDE